MDEKNYGYKYLKYKYKYTRLTKYNIMVGSAGHPQCSFSGIQSQPKLSPTTDLPSGYITTKSSGNHMLAITLYKKSENSPPIKIGPNARGAIWHCSVYSVFGYKDNPNIKQYKDDLINHFNKYNGKLLTITFGKQLTVNGDSVHASGFLSEDKNITLKQIYDEIKDYKIEGKKGTTNRPLHIDIDASKNQHVIDRTYEVIMKLEYV